MTTDNLELEIEKLSPKDGDILAVYFPTDISSSALNTFQQHMNDLATTLKATKPNLTILLLPQGYNMKHLDEEMMKKEGWVSIIRI